MKCAFPYRKSALDTMKADPSLCMGKDLNLKCGPAYYIEVQLQMYVCNVLMCDFVVWISVVLVLPHDARFLSVIPFSFNIIPFHMCQREMSTQRQLVLSILQERTE